MRRLWLLILVGALLGVAYITHEYFEFAFLGIFWAFIVRIFASETVIALFAFTKGFLIRLIGKRVGFLVILSILPLLWRRKIREVFNNLGNRIVAESKERYEWWKVQVWWLQIVALLPVLLIVAAATFLIGGSLGLLAILPVKIPLPPILGAFVRGKIIPMLARVAIGEWLNRVFPSLKEKIPRKYWLLYRKLYIRTIRKLVRTGRISRKRGKQLLEYSREQTNRLRGRKLKPEGTV